MMKTKKTSLLTIIVVALVILSVLAGAFQVVSAARASSHLASSESDGAMSGTAVTASIVNPPLVNILLSTSPAVRVVVGTASVIIGLVIFGAISRSNKKPVPEENE